MTRTAATFCALGAILCAGCSGSRDGADRPLELVVLDPGHFHASLLLKNRLEGVSETVRVYAPEGEEVEQFLAAVEAYNRRADDPTRWREEVYIGSDYLERMIADRRGDVVVLAGNNRRKTGYILEAVRAGYHVLSDKPLAITRRDYELLTEAYRLAGEKGLVIYDLMTERYDALNRAARELVQDRELFGALLPGTADKPAVRMRSVHHFFKTVSGAPLIRPAWYYDVEQQGEGIADVTTHLIDLVAWQCFPEQAVRPDEDVAVVAARHWPTRLSAEEFARSTGRDAFPSYLARYVKDGALEVMANGELVYRVKGIHVGMEVVWNYASSGGDTFSSVMEGSRAVLEVEQNERTGYVKQLYVRRRPETDAAAFEKRLEERAARLRETFPDLTLVRESPDRWRIDLPPERRPGHEAHFSCVAEAFLRYVRRGDVPDWERENTLSKYAVTTSAVEMARAKE